MYLTHPARPIHGGPLDIAITKPLFLDPDIYGDRRAELKLNGFRVEADRAEKILYNRHGEVLSISSEFSEALDFLHALPKRFPRHVDCEGLERRHGYMRGSLIVLDVMIPDATYTERREIMERDIACLANKDFGRENAVRAVASHPLREAWELYTHAQFVNRQLGLTGLNVFFEGILLKQIASKYPIQLTDSKREFKDWAKYKWS
jgi:hypothetical protein